MATFAELIGGTHAATVTWKGLTFTVHYKMRVLGRKRWGELAREDADLAEFRQYL
jgi:hypothetical protein